MTKPTRIVFDATVDEAGKLHPIGALVIRPRLAKMRPRVTVTVERYVKRKTTSQMAYYRAVIVPYWSEHTGYEPDEMHWELKDAWLPKVPHLNRLTGEEKQETPSLAEATAEVMSEFISRCVKEAAMQGLLIPSPDEHFTESL